MYRYGLYLIWNFAKLFISSPEFFITVSNSYRKSKIYKIRTNRFSQNCEYFSFQPILNLFVFSLFFKFFNFTFGRKQVFSRLTNCHHLKNANHGCVDKRCQEFERQQIQDYVMFTQFFIKDLHYDQGDQQHKTPIGSIFPLCCEFK